MLRYLITESPSTPSIDDARWTLTVPTEYDVLGDGTYLLYPWAMNDAGLISAPFAGQSVVVTTTPIPPVAVLNAPNVRLTQSLNLKAALDSRNVIFGVEGLKSGANSIYGTLTYHGDYIWGAMAAPGYFTAAKLRTVLDTFMLSFGGHPTLPYLGAGAFGESAFFPGDQFYNGFWFAYELPIRGSLIPYDAGAWYVQLLKMVYDRGDHTAYAAHKTALIAALDWVPRSASGCVYLDPAQTPPTYGFAWHDGEYITGDVADGTAWNAWAYKHLAVMATAEGDTATATYCEGKRDALIAGLATLRQPSGWYKAGTVAEQFDDVWFSAFIASEGLCTPAEAAATGAAIATEYLAGTITQRGLLRQLISPQYWTNQASYPYDFFQNGGYPTFWAGYAARALVVAGRQDLADQLMAENQQEFLRHERVDGGAPWEWAGGSNTNQRGQVKYASGGATFFDVGDNSPGFVDVVMSAAAATEAFVEMPEGFMVTGARVVAGQAETLGVDVYSAPYVNVINDAIPYVPSYGAETLVFSVPLVAASAVTLNPAPITAWRDVWGGRTKLVVTGAGGAGNLTVRLFTAPLIPSIVSATATFQDDYSTDRLAADYTQTGGTWQVTGGKLQGSNGDAVPKACLATAGGQVQDGTFFMDVTTVNDNAGPFPALMLRSNIGATDYVMVVLVAGLGQVIECTGGVPSLLGQTALYTSGSGVPGTMVVTLSGQDVSISFRGGTVSFTLTKTASAGYFGPVLYSSNAAAIQYDNLTALPTVLAATPLPPGYLLDGGVGSLTYSPKSDGMAVAIAIASGGARLLDWTGAVVAGPTAVGDSLVWTP